MRRLLIAPLILLAAVHAYAFGLGSPARYTNPTFDAAKHLAPLTGWALMFLVGVIALTLAAVSGKLIASAIFIGGAVYTIWACLLGTETFIVGDPGASLIGPCLYLFVGFTHFVGAWLVKARIL